MRINQLLNFTLLTMLFGIPAGGVLLSEPSIAQQRSSLNFQNMYFSSIGIQTISSGSAVTTITLSIQNNGLNNRSFNLSERVSLYKIALVDSQKNAYLGEFEMDLSKPFFYGENRVVKLRVNHPSGIYPSYLQLDSGDPKKPIYIRL
jgi:hypothetical protein